MMKRACVCLGLFLAVGLLLPRPIAAQGGEMGTICVVAYGDTNENGVRDAGEEALMAMNVTLRNIANVVVANHVTIAPAPFCFEGVPPAQYTLHVSHPEYSASEAVVSQLGAAERLTRELGAVRLAAPAVQESILYIPLTLPVRLGVAALGALLAIVIVGGIGMVIFGAFIHRRTDDALPPLSDDHDHPHAEEFGVPLQEDDIPILTRVNVRRTAPLPYVDEEEPSVGSQYDLPQ